jgi:hypothetical protein
MTGILLLRNARKKVCYLNMSHLILIVFNNKNILIKYITGELEPFPYEGDDFDNLAAIAKMIGVNKEDLILDSPIVDAE